MSTPYLTKSASGVYGYRRAVPKSLLAAVGQREIKKSLGRDTATAMKRYADVHKEAEKQLENAKLGPALSLRDEVLKVLKKHKVADTVIDRLMHGGVHGDGSLSAYLDSVHDDLVSEYEDAEERKQAPKVSLEAIRAIGAKVIPPTTYTVASVLDFYVSRMSDPKEPAKTKQLENRVANLKRRMVAALGEHAVTARPLDRMTRADALKVRDYMLTDGLDPSSVQRTLNIVKAAITKAITEFDLDAKNRFMKLEIKGSQASKEDRHPFSDEDMKALTPVMERGNKDPLSVLWVILRDTGARPKEICTLKVRDIDFAQECFSIRFGKTNNSIRTVPLSPAALAALTVQTEGRSPEAAVFPRYALGRGPDSASQAMMKRVRTVISDPLKVAYSLRHRMADKLRDTGCPLDIRKEIMGHDTQNVAANYGSGHALAVKRERLAKVWDEA